MSDQSQGPGWWRASDGKWYPPEGHPDHRPVQSAMDDIGPATAVVGEGTPHSDPANQPLYRRRWFIGAVGVLAIFVLIGALTNPKKRSSSVALTTNRHSTTTITSAPVGAAAASTITASPVTQAPPTQPPPTQPPATQRPTTQAQPALPSATNPPATAPAPSPTAAPADLCGAPPNPMGYNFCNRGAYITTPDPRTCQYFACIQSFSSGTGYMEECADKMYSMAGGRSGACSHHGGELRPVYSGP